MSAGRVAVGIAWVRAAGAAANRSAATKAAHLGFESLTNLSSSVLLVTCKLAIPTYLDARGLPDV